ncbi:sensor histidine kinase [Nonomuraea lactucae]|uniref:sensor histidine kinase n=1 Tax=Nonomuraea lactucae TaxID=2249762 RepID=UPI001F0687F7|nr:HAMP domain-containing sensor histidine kinase [Nonomuraea lactucae]
MITRYGRSVRTRLALLAGIATALISVVVNGFVLYALHSAASDYRKTEVINTGLHVVHLVKRGELPTVISSNLDGIQVVNASGRVVASTANLAGLPRMTDMLPSEFSAHRAAEVCDLPYFPGTCEFLAIFRVYEQDGDWLVYAVDALVPWYVHPGVLAALVAASVLLVALASFGVSRVVARTLAPVEEIRDKLAQITTSDLGKRVPVPRKANEIRSLAETANQTLDRLEAAVEQQRRFASDASHDLRSPITAMRAQVEEAMLHPGDADWQEIGQALVASLDRLQAIVSDLLTLAKLDAGAPTAREPLDLSELVAAETMRQRSKKLITTLQPGVLVTGDRLQLARLLTNLLDNAERHAESNVIVTVRRIDANAMLEVLDDGGGIAPDQRELVFQRFTRLDASRSRDAGGTGLGLSIARDIAQNHHGTLTLEDSDTGARFVLRLPIREI